MTDSERSIATVGSGIPGLDELLCGGYVDGRMYLVTGGPGTGKTTVGMHFLETGLAADETVLFIHGEESSEEVRENAARFGIDITGADFLDLGPDSAFFTDDPSYDLVSPSDVEDHRYTEDIHAAIEDIDPCRVVLDPITQLRYIETSEYHYRKRLLSFMRFLKSRDITVLSTATPTSQVGPNTEIRSLSDGVVRLTRTEDGRRIEVEKNRGNGQIDGDHGLAIRSQGVEVFPRVRPQPTDRQFDPVPFISGIDELDVLTGGGFERGTVTFLSGPPGVGKTTTGTLYLTEAAAAGHRGVIYLFEERMETFRHRCRTLGIPVDDLVESGALEVEVIDPLARSAEEFAHMIRHEVEEDDVEAVMIDGLGGYTSAIQGDQEDLKRDLHALTRYLVHAEVSVFVTDSIHQIAGISSATSVNISPIADNILFLSYVERSGSLEKVVGLLKKRTGDFQHALRSFDISTGGVCVGEQMTGMQGILQGAPRADQMGTGPGPES